MFGRLCSFAVVIALAATLSSRLPASDADTPPELKLTASALEPILSTLDPKPAVSYSSSSASLVVTYLPQTYKIHRRSMSGEIAPNAHDEVGPSFKGFVLRVRLQSKGDVNQAVTPQTLHGPYWQTDIDVTPMAASQKQMYWALSYGSRTDPDLVTKIRQTMYALQDPSEKQNEPTHPKQ